MLSAPATDVSQVTVFTGFLGAGKTSLILALLKQLPADYRVVVLKNEFGDAETDSALVRESNIAVQEMVNGCLCCVLVGQMKTGLLELKAKYRPHRILIETSGSAFPAPIAWQVRELADEGFALDSVVTVIDCANFTGYEDTSYTAKMQAQYTDLILLNKHHLVSERDLDTVIDRVNDLNTDTPRVKCGAPGDVPISADLVFGIDTPLFALEAKAAGSALTGSDDAAGHHHRDEVDRLEITKDVGAEITGYDPAHLDVLLKSLPCDDIYRVKGIVRLTKSVDQTSGADPAAGLAILNFAFGRYTLTPLTQATSAERHANTLVRVTVLGQDLRLHQAKLAAGFLADNQADVHFHARGAAAH
ncbi:hypothetical protein IWQ60_003386 [Tieghemiomyces parasiticus]|uniref:CobW/HypB/UreG nucleotide-binding domain-containing protein n=1 Tax=Tieghemiomyces parasiticus TaxID=78921 RepID=A0A9W8E0Q8_9FUNG|nr:hypothetical protein IWQ60_003386 [Tieghemiomyces parasiticus]